MTTSQMFKELYSPIIWQQLIKQTKNKQAYNNDTKAACLYSQSQTMSQMFKELYSPIIWQQLIKQTKNKQAYNNDTKAACFILTVANVDILEVT